MPLLSEIGFGSYLVYSPAGQSAKSRKSVTVCHAVKQDSALPVASSGHSVRVIPYLVEHLAANFERTPLREMFAARPVLVPAPRSSLVKPDTLSPTRVICRELVTRGLGSDLQEFLERTIAVPKAAFQKPADRPTVSQHFASMRVSRELQAPAAILLVDDVVTSGGMLLACVSRLQEAFPQSRIDAFALVRTMSGMEVEALLDPCVGIVRLRGDRGHRVP